MLCTSLYHSGLYQLILVCATVYQLVPGCSRLDRHASYWSVLCTGLCCVLVCALYWSVLCTGLLTLFEESWL